MPEWFNISLWIFGLLAGIVLYTLTYSRRYIGWVRERLPMPDEKIKLMERSGGIILATLSVLSLLKLLLIG
ncbi:hypothetical protein DesLBE_1995 [Desulfitobacterium sp. LBE]|uniref:Uncharacterized protein n=3 Tax=root TaxID=1 RepID=G9XWH6_DESHA|nr:MULTISPECIES: hypothetical protein [Desulfitobacterium]ACL19434.1 hypothetical protein Dhaf_1378 [Desulfitobacterium hafniense DCB-2]EHL04056.1 hypothetical protein HMPREF0322_05343 [Desulfitobacterium hafniense DP7]MEA5023612.1 hypothetical protein [Desulfitobacterium hafniense]TWH57706.1 hypothetical protein DesLBE_1995 [Desulfitobacterium sp. LBE]